MENSVAQNQKAPEPSKPHITPPVDVVDLLAAMKLAGFNTTGTSLWQFSVEEYLRFATKETADKVRGFGKQLQREEAEEDATPHRKELQEQTYILWSQPIKVPTRTDFSEKGLVITVNIPLRLHWDVDHSSDPPHRGENIYNVTLFRGDTSETWFLTKDMQLRKCKDDAETATANRNGIVYYPEGLTTDVGLFLNVGRKIAIEISEDKRDIYADLVFSHLKRKQEYEWGYYKRKGLQEYDWESDLLLVWNHSGAFNGEPPYYFRPDSIKTPEVVSATFEAVRLRDRFGNIIAAYPPSEEWTRFVLPEVPRSSRPQHDTSSERQAASVNNASQKALPITEKVEPPSLGNGAFAGLWKSENGVVLRLTDEGADVTVTLTSKDKVFKSLEGVLKRSGEKWQDKDVLKGTLTAVFNNDPLSEGGNANTRTLAARRMFFKDDSTLRLITEKVVWNKAGKETSRVADTVDFTRSK